MFIRISEGRNSYYNMGLLGRYDENDILVEGVML